MIARLTRNIWAIAPEFDYTRDFIEAALLPVKGSLVAVAAINDSRIDVGPYIGTLLEGPYTDYYATDLSSFHFQEISPLEELAAQCD